MTSTTTLHRALTCCVCCCSAHKCLFRNYTCCVCCCSAQWEFPSVPLSFYICFATWGNHLFKLPRHSLKHVKHFVSKAKRKLPILHTSKFQNITRPPRVSCIRFIEPVGTNLQYIKCFTQYNQIELMF